jgi:hypothetical protein
MNMSMIMLETRAPLGLEEYGLGNVLSDPEPQSRSGSLREAEEDLAPVALMGGLVGAVVDRSGLPAPAHVVIRDRNRVVVKECYTGTPRAGSAGGRFEIWGLPTGTYVVEITASGFAPELRHGVRIEGPCLTQLGAIRLTRAYSPSISVPTRRDAVAPTWAIPTRFPKAFL